MFFDFLVHFFNRIICFCSSVGGESFPKPLSSEDEKKYITAFREEGDLKAKEILIEHNMRLVAHIVKKYQGAAENDDLISVGSIGLIKAINTYIPGKGTQLATYTARCIENEILMLLRANKKHKNTLSLSDTIGVDKDGNELELIDLMSDEGESVIDKVENGAVREKFKEVIKNCLDDREYQIITLRYGLINGVPLPQRELAKKLHISRSYVSRIEKKALLKIKEEIKDKRFFTE